MFVMPKEDVTKTIARFDKLSDFAKIAYMTIERLKVHGWVEECPYEDYWLFQKKGWECKIWWYKHRITFNRRVRRSIK